MTKPEYMNSDKFCMICFKGPEMDGKGKEARTLKLIKHHVTYNPEKIIWVHFKCHGKIHDPDNPMRTWIQYTEGEKKLFYKNKKQTDKTLGTMIKYNL